MINKRLIEQLKKTNEDIAKQFEAIGKLSEDQYTEIMKMIDKVKQEKKEELAKQKLEAIELKKNASKIKQSNKTDIKKKGKIDSYLLSISEANEEVTKKQSKLNKATDQLIDKTSNIKKESLSLMGMFQKKEINREFKLTFTDTSKITTKSIVFKNSMIENVIIGQSSPKSTSKYKEKKLKLLRSISKRFDITIKSGDNGQSGEKPKEQPKEQPKDSGPSVATEVGTGAAGIGVGALVKKYLPKALSNGVVEEGAAKAGTGLLKGGFKTFAKALPVIGGIIGTVAALKSLVDRVPASIKGYADYESKGLHKAALGQLGGGVIGSAGDIIGGISSWVPGPLGWLGMGAGYLLSTFGDSLSESSKDYKDDKKTFGVEPGDDKTKITLDKLNAAKKQIKQDRDSVSQMDAINYLNKKNQQDFISAMGGKSKSFLLPKYEFDGKFVITPEELELRSSLEDATTILPSPEPSLPTGMEAPSAHTMKKGTTDNLIGMLPSNTYVTSEYQLHRTLIKDGKVIRDRPHKGRDYGVKEGTPITSTISGALTFLSGGDYGNNARIQTDDGYTLIFAHLSAFGADKNGKVGQKIQIKPGQIIGYSGHSGLNVSSGGGTGSHLHFEVRNQEGIAIDPTKWTDHVKEMSTLKNDYSLPSVETPKPIDLHKEGYKYGKEAALHATAKLKGK